MKTGASVYILGIDPGSAATGYAVLEDVVPVPRVVAVGVIRGGKKALSVRLAKIFSELQDIMQQHRPDEVAVEEVFHARNTKSALVLSHARGVALLAAGLAGAKVYEYPTRTVKQTVTGYGGADKEQVRKMLVATLGSAPESLDASDALAVALCHLRWSEGPVAPERKRS